VAGYSGTPLAKKLGIKADHRIGVLGAPDGFVIAEVPDGVVLSPELTTSPSATRTPLDLVLAFDTRRADRAERLPGLMRAIRVDGSLWVAWPKRSSGVETDITEDVVRDVALPSGLVDNKVCAVDDVWSGLRLVLRKELRPGRTTLAG
jgi:hypothetical protein